MVKGVLILLLYCTEMVVCRQTAAAVTGCLPARTARPFSGAAVDRKHWLVHVCGNNFHTRAVIPSKKAAKVTEGVHLETELPPPESSSPQPIYLQLEVARQ